jgi:hypothetical protein
MRVLSQSPQQQKQPEQQQSEQGQNQEPDEDLGWDEDKDKQPQDENGQDGEDGEDGEDSQPQDEDGQDPNNQGGNNGGGGNNGQPTDDPTDPTQDAYNMDLIEAINQIFATDDILSKFKTRIRFMSTLKIDEDAIYTLAPYVGITDTTRNETNKDEILNRIDEQIKPFYNKI